MVCGGTFRVIDMGQPKERGMNEINNKAPGNEGAWADLLSTLAPEKRGRVRAWLCGEPVVFECEAEQDEFAREVGAWLDGLPDA